MGEHLALQTHPAPGRVSIVEAEEPLVMIRGDSGHLAKTSSLRIRLVGESIDRAGDWAGRQPRSLSLPHSAVTIIKGQ